MSYTITRLNSKIDSLKTKLDSLKTIITYRKDELEDIGTNNESEYYNMIDDLIEKSNIDIQTIIYKLEAMYYGKGPTGSNPNIIFK